MLFNLFLKKHAQHFMLLSKKTGMHFKNKQMAHASHYRQNSLIHSNRLVEVKQQRRNWKHTSAFWLKRAYMWHVKLDGTANVTAVRKLTSVKITKGCLLRKAFGRVSYQPKQKCMSEERTQYRGGGGSQTWEQNGRQGRRENAGCEGHIRTVCTGRRRKKPQQKTHICSGITIWT